MSGTVRDWLNETHGTRLELLRHFLRRFFDNDLIGSSGDWTRTAAGALAMVVSSWILLFVTLISSTTSSRRAASCSGSPLKPMPI
ncbi:MAG: hypothetical protein QM757_14425 [Paludibaculum sp.]